jgi:hypothetical protein
VNDDEEVTADLRQPSVEDDDWIYLPEYDVELRRGSEQGDDPRTREFE